MRLTLSLPPTGVVDWSLGNFIMDAASRLNASDSFFIDRSFAKAFARSLAYRAVCIKKRPE
eukprot:CAMPEP_0172466582 /NCGR_PEP_ID=MMETSP1065-20121228/56616_1 /TAXON_ID=265537 /ORGANISM="Amphiprora paludosa, Strain CCMP125" /LENGTH=60 /DNA_ID=CAMNT_0013223437 /DNA_START=104 /DNA_END=286 /DNA_ORIENTATION=+